MAFTPITELGASSKSEMPYNSKVEGIRNAAIRDFSSNYSPTQCTWWASGRSIDCGLNGNFEGLGNARSWEWNYKGSKVYTFSYSSVSPGDILVFKYNGAADGQPGHVVFVESVSGNSMVVSEAANTDNHPLWLCVSKVSGWSGGSHWFWSGAYGDTFVCILKNSGSGSGGDIEPVEPPVDPPTPGEEGHWEPVYQDIEVEYDTADTYMTDRYECAPNSRAGDSGTQDQPKVPKWWGTATTRHNFRWDPLICYTDERIMIYDSNKERVWSQWEQVDMQDNFVPESQIGTDQWLPGWLKDWEDGG